MRYGCKLYACRWGITLNIEISNGACSWGEGRVLMSMFWFWVNFIQRMSTLVELNPAAAPNVSEVGKIKVRGKNISSVYE